MKESPFEEEQAQFVKPHNGELPKPKPVHPDRQLTLEVPPLEIEPEAPDNIIPMPMTPTLGQWIDQNKVLLLAIAGLAAIAAVILIATRSGKTIPITNPIPPTPAPVPAPAVVAAPAAPTA